MQFIIIIKAQKYRKRSSLYIWCKDQFRVIPFTLYDYSFTVNTKIHTKGDRETQFAQVKQLKHFLQYIALLTSILACLNWTLGLQAR